MTSLLALLSSLLWGSADFEGGRLSKRHAPIAVLGFSQIIGLLFGVGLLIAYGDWSTPALGEGGFLIPGIGAGFFGYFGLICLYAGLASGSMGVDAWFAGLPTIVFGETWLKNAPGVFHVQSISDVKNALSQINQGFQQDKVAVKEFMDWTTSNSFKGNLWPKNNQEKERASSLTEMAFHQSIARQMLQIGQGFSSVENLLGSLGLIVS